MIKNKIFKTKVKSLTLTELLVVMVIIGILTFLAVPRLMPLITKARSTEAQTHLLRIKQLQETYKQENTFYISDLDELGFETEKSILEDKENGTRYYEYKILSATQSNFRAQAKSLVDFDEDGTLNIWEITETGKAKEITKD